MIKAKIMPFQNHLLYRDNLRFPRIQDVPVCEEGHHHHGLQ